MGTGWKVAAWVIAVVACAGGLYLKYWHGMRTRVALVSVAGVLGGSYGIIFALFSSEETIRSNEQAKRVVDKVGLLAARLFWFLLGVVLIGIGGWLLYDHFGQS
jgi:hypothetical protein